MVHGVELAFRAFIMQCWGAVVGVGVGDGVGVVEGARPWDRTCCVNHPRLDDRKSSSLAYYQSAAMAHACCVRGSGWKILRCKTHLSDLVILPLVAWSSRSPPWIISNTDCTVGTSDSWAP